MIAKLKNRLLRERYETMKTQINHRMVILFAVLMLILAGLPSVAWSQMTGRDGAGRREASDEVGVVVARMDGLSNRGQHLVMLQGSLKNLGPIRVLRTRRFQQEARALRVTQVIPEDARALVDVSRALGADAIIFVNVSQSEPNGNSQSARVGVYAGDDGRFMGETVVNLPGQRPKATSWDNVAMIIKPMILQTVPREDVGRIQPTRLSPPPRVDRQRRKVRRPDSAGGWADQEGANRVTTTNDGRPLISVVAGPYSMSRTFKYTVAPESNRFTEGGIEYELGFVPGFSLALEVTPLARTHLAMQGLILGVGYEKVFFRTQQTVFTETSVPEVRAPTESSYSNLTLKLGYRFLLPAEAEFDAIIGFGLRSFEIPDNDEYAGNRYSSFNLGVAGYVPFGTPFIGAQLQALFMPVTGLGDTLQELGGDATTTGFAIRVGLESRTPLGIVITAAVDYAGYFVDISGEGRDGRIGKSASDGFLGLNLQVGYRY